MIWVKVLSKQEFGDNDFIRLVIANGKKISLIKDQGVFYAVQNNCPHAGGMLSDGWCKEGHIVCPIHRWQYSLTTGRGVEGQGDYVDIYPTKLKEDGLYVGIKESFWKRIFS